MEDLSFLLSIFTGIFSSFWELLSWAVSAAWNSGVEASYEEMAASIACSVLVLGSGFAAATVAEMREGRRFIHMILGFLFPIVYPLALHLLMPKPKYLKNLEGGGPSSAPEAPADPLPLSAPSIEIPKKEDKTDKMAPLPSMPPANAPVAPPDDVTRTLSRSELFAASQKPRVEIPGSGSVSTKTPAPFERTAEPQPVASQEPNVYDQRYFASISFDSAGQPRGPFMVETDDGRYLEALKIIGAQATFVILEAPAEGGKVKNVRLPYSKIKSCALKSDWLGQ